MIMLGCKFMGDVPFRDVYIHALIRDEQGQKMSKSKGNVIDPLIMMEKYGTDAFRFTLSIFAAQGRDIILSEKRIEGYRAFINKIWNSTKFILMNLGDGFRQEKIVPADLEHFDRWILHALNRAIESVDSAISEYKFNEAAQAIYAFWWHEFCDWYLELTKQRIYSEEGSMKKSSETAKQVLFHVLKKSLQLLHPFMPFITEEIWENITEGGEGRIIISEWPKPAGEYNFAADGEEADIFKEIVYRIRNIRGVMNIPPDRKANVVFKTSSKRIASILSREEHQIKALAKVGEMKIDEGYMADKNDASAVMTDVEIFIPLKGLIDMDKERQRLGREIDRIRADLDRIEKKLSDPNFKGKAPESIIEKEKNKRQELGEILSGLEKAVSKLG